MDILIKYPESFAPGFLTFIAVAAGYHALAFESVESHSKLLTSSLWLLVALGCLSAFFLAEPKAALFLITLAVTYTWLLLTYLRKLSKGQPGSAC